MIKIKKCDLKISRVAKRVTPEWILGIRMPGHSRSCSVAGVQVLQRDSGQELAKPSLSQTSQDSWRLIEIRHNRRYSCGHMC